MDAAFEYAPQTLARWTGGRWTEPPRSGISGFAFDSRLLREGQMFVALKTGARDGHGFLSAARAAGARAALVSTPDRAVPLPQLQVGDTLAAFQAIARERRREFKGKVVGVTGSAGKTSTKELLALLLGGAGAGGSGAVLSTEGNLNNHIGVPLTLTRLDPAVHHYAVVEAGISAPGEMAPLASMIEPDVAIVTLVGPAHLEELGGLEGVAREKAALAAAVREGGFAIFPKSCAGFQAFRKLKVRTLVVGPRPSPIVFSVEHRRDLTEVALKGDWPKAVKFTLRRVTDGMAQNAALAVCAALYLGVPATSVQRRLAKWLPAPLRGELRKEKGRLVYVDCYNANPASMADALEGFVRIAPRTMPRLFLIGCMEELGAGSGRYHRELGRNLALRRQDSLVVVGGLAEEVRAGALERGARPGQIAVEPSAEAAAPRLASFKGAVFVKGSRKHELERALPC